MYVSAHISSIHIYNICIYIYIYIYIFIYQSIFISSFRYTHVITSRKIRLKQTWRLTKAMTEIKPDTEQTMKLQ